jgi:CTP:molybdopterin cytidylyltransferase MocA
MSDRTLLVLLAAGAGSRFEAAQHKLLAPLAGRPVIEHAVAAALASGVGPLLVVAGAVALPESVTGRAGVRVVDNPAWADGQSTSLAVAIDIARTEGVDAIVVGLGDQPFVTPDAWRGIAASSSPIAVAVYDGERRNPVRLHRSVWHLIAHQGDEGARSLIQLRPDLVEPVPCTGSSADVDTVEDLKVMEDLLRWQSKSSTNSP